MLEVVVCDDKENQFKLAELRRREEKKTKKMQFEKSVSNEWMSGSLFLRWWSRFYYLVVRLLRYQQLQQKIKSVTQQFFFRRRHSFTSLYLKKTRNELKCRVEYWQWWIRHWNEHLKLKILIIFHQNVALIKIKYFPLS